MTRTATGGAPPPTPRPARRHRSGRRLGALVAVAALLAVVSSSATSAQEIPDVPPLGFEITPGEGAVGSTVQGQVDTDDIAEHCITDPAEFVDSLLNGFGPAFIDYVESVAEGDLDPSQPLDYTRFLTILTILGIAGDTELAASALGSTFVMAFADLATASPIAPFGTFDPVTGQGATLVPDLPAGVHPVIATCVALPSEFSVEDLAAAEQAGLTYLVENFEQPFPQDFFAEDSEFAAVAAEVFPVILRELVEPQALGVAFYCVTDASGACPGGGPPPPPPPPPGGEGPDGEGPDGEGPDGGGGPDGGAGPDGATPPGAQPIPGRPAYTG